MHLASRHVGVIALVVLGLALSGCGSTNVNAKPSTSPLPRGANPATWVGVFCGGLGDAIAGNSQLVKTMPPTSQSQKDALLQYSDATRQLFTDTANQLTRLGPPAVSNGKQAQGSAISFFTATAAALSEQRGKLAALDTNDPNFAQKANQLVYPNVGDMTQLQAVTNNSEIGATFYRAPACQRLIVTPTPAH